MPWAAQINLFFSRRHVFRAYARWPNGFTSTKRFALTGNSRQRRKQYRWLHRQLSKLGTVTIGDI